MYHQLQKRGKKIAFYSIHTTFFLTNHRSFIGFAIDLDFRFMIRFWYLITPWYFSQTLILWLWVITHLNCIFFLLLSAVVFTFFFYFKIYFIYYCYQPYPQFIILNFEPAFWFAFISASLMSSTNFISFSSTPSFSLLEKIFNKTISKDILCRISAEILYQSDDKTSMTKFYGSF